MFLSFFTSYKIIWISYRINHKIFFTNFSTISTIENLKFLLRYRNQANQVCSHPLFFIHFFLFHYSLVFSFLLIFRWILYFCCFFFVNASWFMGTITCVLCGWWSWLTCCYCSLLSIHLLFYIFLFLVFSSFLSQWQRFFYPIKMVYISFCYFFDFFSSH